MTKPRSARQFHFPFKFEKNGRTGKIYRLGNGTFKTAFTFAGLPNQNTFKTPQAAFEYLDREFSKLDSDRENSLALHPLNGNVKSYAELEHLVREQGNGATLRDAVQFYLMHNKTKKLDPKTCRECVDLFLEHREADNVSPMSLKTFKKHLNRFAKDFGSRLIHEITTLEISNWLKSRRDEKTKQPWTAMTKTKVRGSLVSISIFAQKELKAIPDLGDTEFQNVSIPKLDEKAAVEIYTPGDLKKLFDAAVENDVELIPALVAGGFLGLRPFEFHGEGLKREPLSWEAFNWTDLQVHFKGQKIRSKATRDIPLQAMAQEWLKPFKSLAGRIWTKKKAFDYRMNSLHEKAKVARIDDGLRHSYASYRVRQTKGNLVQVAAEMGNSPQELIDSYKRNVTDTQVSEWETILPPPEYETRVKVYLSTRQN